MTTMAASTPRQLRTARITFDDGRTITTNINGTDEEIRDYYLGAQGGSWFNFGIDHDDMHRAVAVDVID